MVNFGLNLKRQLVPEWAPKYIDYEQLKKLLKDIEKSQKEHGDCFSESYKKHQIPSLEPGLLPFSELERGLSENIEESDPQTDSCLHIEVAPQGVISTVITFPFPDAVEAEVAFFEYLDEAVNTASLFFDEVLRQCYDRMVECDKTAMSCRDEIKMLYERDKAIKHQSSMKMAYSKIRTGALRIENFGRGVTGHKPDTNIQNKQIEDLKVYTHTISAAFKDLYQKLIMLQEFKIANQTAVRKILKKHDKISTNFPIARKHYLLAASHTRMFSDSRIEVMAQLLEKSYNKYFGAENTKNIHNLHGTGVKEKVFFKIEAVDNRNVFCAGFFGGMTFCACFFLAVLVVVFPAEHYGVGNPIHRCIFVYRCMSLMLLHMWLFCLCVYCWDHMRINYLFILTLNSLPGLNFKSLTRFCSMCCFPFVLSLVVYYIVTHEDIMLGEQRYSVSWSPSSSDMVPFSLCLIVVLFVANPWSCFMEFQSREFKFSARWFIFKTLGQLLLTPAKHVKFQHFFIADQLLSHNTAIQDAVMTVCYFSTGQYKLEHPGCRVAKFNGALASSVAMIPAFIRVMQCFRRYKDSGRHMHPHLTNMGKYATLIVASLVSLAARQQKALKQLSYLFTAISTMYSFSWDIKMDWGLLRWEAGQVRFGRKKMMLPQKLYPVYGFAVVLDLIFRLVWVLSIFSSMFVDEDMQSYWIWLVATLEVIRRSMWNFFRMEYEHVGNVDQYRATTDIVLPPAPAALCYIHPEEIAAVAKKQAERSKEPDADVPYMLNQGYPPLSPEEVVNDAQGQTSDVQLPGCSMKRGDSSASRSAQEWLGRATSDASSCDSSAPYLCKDICVSIQRTSTTSSNGSAHGMLRAMSMTDFRLGSGRTLDVLVEEITSSENVKERQLPSLILIPKGTAPQLSSPSMVKYASVSPTLQRVNTFAGMSPATMQSPRIFSPLQQPSSAGSIYEAERKLSLKCLDKVHQMRRPSNDTGSHVGDDQSTMGGSCVDAKHDVHIHVDDVKELTLQAEQAPEEPAGDPSAHDVAGTQNKGLTHNNMAGAVYQSTAADIMHLGEKVGSVGLSHLEGVIPAEAALPQPVSAGREGIWRDTSWSTSVSEMQRVASGVRWDQTAEEGQEMCRAPSGLRQESNLGEIESILRHASGSLLEPSSPKSFVYKPSDKRGSFVPQPAPGAGVMHHSDGEGDSDDEEHTRKSKSTHFMKKVMTSFTSTFHAEGGFAKLD